MCIDNEGYPVSLELFKVYQVADAVASDELLSRAIRIIDKSGETYLFDASRFVPVELPAESERAFAELTARLDREWADYLATLGPEEKGEEEESEVHPAPAGPL
jgi:hypothetical protein